MRCVTYNIQYSRGKDGRLDLARCIDAVRGADILALQEVERNWVRSGKSDQPALIGEMFPQHYWVYGPSFDVHCEGAMVNGRIVNRRRQFGDMLLSRWPIVSSRLVVLPKTHYDDRFNMHMGAVEAVIAIPSGPIRVWSIHIGYLGAAERREHLRALIEFQRRGQRESGAWSGPGAIRGDDWTGGSAPPPMPSATLWLGDFNMVPGSEEYSLVTGEGEGYPGFVDAWAATSGPDEVGITCPNSVFDGITMDRRIDYCFVSLELSEKILDSWIDENANGSDHQPVWLELDC